MTATVTRRPGVARNRSWEQPDLPSRDTLSRRADKAGRQAAFAKSAGWPEVSELYERLRAGLEALARRADGR